MHAGTYPSTITELAFQTLQLTSVCGSKNLGLLSLALGLVLVTDRLPSLPDDIVGFTPSASREVVMNAMCSTDSDRADVFGVDVISAVQNARACAPTQNVARPAPAPQMT